MFQSNHPSNLQRLAGTIAMQGLNIVNILIACEGDASHVVGSRAFGRCWMQRFYLLKIIIKAVFIVFKIKF